LIGFEYNSIIPSPCCLPLTLEQVGEEVKCVYVNNILKCIFGSSTSIIFHDNLDQADHGRMVKTSQS
jgi:hypothetical protein